MAYQDYMLFGDACLPDPDAPGSALLWHDFRILRHMQLEFENAQQQQAAKAGDSGVDPDELELKEDGGWQAPPPLKGKYRMKKPPGTVGRET